MLEIQKATFPAFRDSTSFCWVTLQECLKIFLGKKKKINKNQNNMIEPKLPYFLISREVIRYRKLKTLLVWEAYSIHLWVKRNKINKIKTCEWFADNHRENPSVKYQSAIKPWQAVCLVKEESPPHSLSEFLVLQKDLELGNTYVFWGISVILNIRGHKN